MVDLVPRLPDEVLVVDLLATAAALRPETPGKRGHDDFRPLAEVDVEHLVKLSRRRWVQ